MTIELDLFCHGFWNWVTSYAKVPSSFWKNDWVPNSCRFLSQVAYEIENRVKYIHLCKSCNNYSFLLGFENENFFDLYIQKLRQNAWKNVCHWKVYGPVSISTLTHWNWEIYISYMAPWVWTSHLKKLWRIWCKFLVLFVYTK